jgi:hypothetical protein
VCPSPQDQVLIKLCGPWPAMSTYPQSQHESPALNRPLKRSAEFTPLPLH